MTLIPEALSPLRLRLTEEISGEPVGCARIHMVPKAVPAALQGPMVFSTDAAGNVATIPVPEGGYLLKVEAPGYADLAQDMEHKAVTAPVELKLKAITRSISCSFAVTGEGGKPLGGAEVELWEVYPLARIASGKTDAGGSVIFSGLRLGTVNPVDRDKLLPVSHRAEAAVRVQAQGHVTTIQSVRLMDGGRLSVTLDPQIVVPEQASHDSKGTAQPLRLGQSASFKIEKPTDQDWFVFRSSRGDPRDCGRQQLSHQTMTTIFDAAGGKVGDFAKYAGHPASRTLDLAAGRYWIQVTEWGMNGSSEAEVLMTLSAETAADPLESNNSAAEARPIQVGQHLRGILFPVGDSDCFALRLDRPGCLRLESVNTPGVERTVVVVDKNGVQRAVLNCYAGNGGASEWQIEAGDYHVVVIRMGQ